MCHCLRSSMPERVQATNNGHDILWSISKARPWLRYEMVWVSILGIISMFNLMNFYAKSIQFQSLGLGCLVGTNLVVCYSPTSVLSRSVPKGISKAGSISVFPNANSFSALFEHSPLFRASLRIWSCIIWIS